jgi:hypothetical protein
MLSRHIDGEPTLEWYKIQDQIRASETDILLLLDCCYAAQAARHRERTKGKFEILAAAAMGVETPAPGVNSFTSILLREIASAVDSGQEFVNVKDIHGQLCTRQQKLYATPVHVCLKPASHTIRLAPLATAPPTGGAGSEEAHPKSFFQLLVEIREELDDDSMEQVSRWLKTDVPWIVSRVEVLERTENVGQAIGRIHQGNGALGKRLRGSEVEEEIDRSWSRIVTSVEQYHDSIGAAGTSTAIESKRRRVGDLVRQLDTENDHIVDLIEQHILTTPIDGENTLETAVHDDTAQVLGMVDQLRLCSLVRSSYSGSEYQPSNTGFPPLPGPDSGPPALEEVKQYGPYIDPRELPELARRVDLLANLLTAPKSAAFRSLQCTTYVHTPLAQSYTFHFRVPSVFAGHEHVPLSWIIKRTKGNHRPTLNERLRMAHMLSRAVLKWHSVGWVHQGISSHNIIFFRDAASGYPAQRQPQARGARAGADGAQGINYSEPFLHGLEFARPDSDPSIGRALDDIEFNIYRHPDRQGNARRGHQKKHDIYSLGVVLLEIGLWQNMAEMFRNMTPPPTANDLAKTLARNCSERLAHFSGTSYRDVVDLCLSSKFGVEIDDEFGSHLTKAFQQRVVDVLAKGVSLY